MGRDSIRTRDPDRKQKILAAAGTLIGRRGYHAVSMTDIGQKAGITGSGIYRHFDGKSAILVALFDEIMDGLIAQQASQLEDAADPAATLRRVVDGQVQFVVQRRELAPVYYSEIQSLPRDDQMRLRRKQRLYLEEWVHLVREVHPDIDDALARTLVHAAVGAIQSYLFHNVGMERDRLMARLATAATRVLEIDP
jgi:AcrR family transcriptional regulator